jgi:hypothetical protein
MYTSHSCMKTHFVKNRTGQTISITTPALYVKTVNQDLLSCKKCNKIGIRVILEEDTDISGLYMLDRDCEQRIEDLMPFISEYSDLYLIKTEETMLFAKVQSRIIQDQYLGHQCHSARLTSMSLSHPLKVTTMDLF